MRIALHRTVRQPHLSANPSMSSLLIDDLCVQHQIIYVVDHGIGRKIKGIDEWSFQIGCMGDVAIDFHQRQNEIIWFVQSR